MLQQPARWSHDFDPDTGLSRASLRAETPLFEQVPYAPTLPPGDSSQGLATTEFVYQSQAEFVEEAVRKARIGIVDGSGASPGHIGEFIRINTPPTGIELTSNQFAQINSIELSPGDWEIYASTGWNGPGAPNSVNAFFAATINDTGGFSGFGGTNTVSLSCTPLVDTNLSCAWRYNISAPATVFQMAYCQWASSARVFAYGCLTATRVR